MIFFTGAPLACAPVPSGALTPPHPGGCSPLRFASPFHGWGFVFSCPPLRSPPCSKNHARKGFASSATLHPCRAPVGGLRSKLPQFTPSLVFFAWALVRFGRGYSSPPNPQKGGARTRRGFVWGATAACVYAGTSCPLRLRLSPAWLPNPPGQQPHRAKGLALRARSQAPPSGLLPLLPPVVPPARSVGLLRYSPPPPTLVVRARQPPLRSLRCSALSPRGCVLVLLAIFTFIVFFP